MTIEQWYTGLALVQIAWLLFAIETIVRDDVFHNRIVTRSDGIITGSGLKHDTNWEYVNNKSKGTILLKSDIKDPSSLEVFMLVTLWVYLPLALICNYVTRR